MGTPVLDLITQSGWLLTRFPIPDSRFPIPDSRFPLPCSLLPAPCSLLPAPCSLKTRNLYLTISIIYIFLKK
ncbi:hypothetical protein [Moorena sp. SIO3I6]|uniref:hypothetical protein n=1 Tax=Moorena sp. SIO3I6 TaxID=2607831 RepID=UPI0013FAEAE4|nr:hypothetical protein [Moorena sp. SIO3I6]NEP26959.1 hypothetical protein [Moorena sp. SIO3I6]